MAAMLFGKVVQLAKQNFSLLIFLLVNGAITWLVPLYYGEGSDQFADFRHVTMEDLLAQVNYTEPKSTPEQEPAPVDNNLFPYNKVVCPKNQLVNVSGHHGKFAICVTSTLAARTKDYLDYFGVGRAAYFIGGKRDELLEENFRKATNGFFKIKVFPDKAESPSKESQTILAPSKGKGMGAAHSVEYFNIGPLTDWRSGEHGLKDLIDERDDGNRLEYIKLDVGNRTELLLFSINIALDFCQVLMRRRFASFDELRNFIGKMNAGGFYPYAIAHFSEEPAEGTDSTAHTSNITTSKVVHYLSFMKKSCMKRYAMGEELVDAVWKREELFAANST